MKCNEFLREIKEKGWYFVRQGKGSHEIWSNGERQETIPNHGTKELGKGLEQKLRKRLGLK
ncbi:type II toxin-antitoxin system HicA family toxin [Tannerella sp.]|uniref:type II toxin-antitoxin system HicA family toxin n=1 Tax=Tannerella sp. TaxID=2382127 RepID=UPI0026DD710E|nr:type II toxin-antitoxin system HicA family toxin [Tannerella sp.]MDO4704430.1 type II toxin-antitoxin system HicA family toxin [Tannerella sp.]